MIIPFWKRIFLFLCITRFCNHTCISFSSSNIQFSESRISISPIQGVAKCFFLIRITVIFIETKISWFFFRRFVVKEFVKTCDEHVPWRGWWRPKRPCVEKFHCTSHLCIRSSGLWSCLYSRSLSIVKKSQKSIWCFRSVLSPGLPL